MELELQKEQICTNRKIYSGRMEHIETTEIIIPDYLPDVRAVISSQAQIYIKDKSAADDKITVSGEIHFTALFAADGDKSPLSVSGRAPFVEIFKAAAPASNAFVRVSVNLGQNEAHIVNSRKIGFRAVLEIDVSAYEPQTIETVSGFSKEIDVKTLKTAKDLCLFTSYAEKMISVEEDLYLPQSSPSAKELLSYRARLISDSVKLISNKAIIKGSAKVVFVYLSADGTPELETFESEIPFSLIADMPGVLETFDAETAFEISNVTAALSSDSGGRTFSVSISASVSVCAYMRAAVESITDAFSTTHELFIKTDESPVYNLFEKKSAAISIRDSIKPPDGMDIAKVADIYCELSAFDSTIKGGEIKLTASADVRALCISDEGAAFCAMKTLPVNLSVATGGNKKAEVCVNAPPPELSFNLNMSGEIEIKIVGEASIYIFENTPFTCVVSAEAQKKTDETGDDLPALFAYFPDKKETIWDIAKKYGASPEDIIGANSLSASVQSALDTSHMLLIPRIKLSGK
ncbi:MAG: DUF3794 domain-containing protein [Clostridia bacterium]|nr:DUF3794 domain-containing protein [Clostridia bacterium]